jgi:cysteine-rich repeat protein
MMVKSLWLTVVLAGAGCGFGDNNAVQRTASEVCGDGTVNPGEGCDDGNLLDGDGCSERCSVEVANPVCGNGTREANEACDDGNTSAGDGCSATCTNEIVCGNGTREGSEECDDGNVASGDGCSPTCSTEPATACSLVPQGGCSGATPACDIDATQETSCRAVTTQGVSNSHCASDTACRAGYTCVGEDNAVEDPFCARFCIADSDCTGAGSRCVHALVDAQNTPLNVNVCSNACNPVTQTGCPSGMGCIAATATSGDLTDCIYMGTTPDGGACNTPDDCQEGSSCVTSNGVSVCRSFCLVGDDSTCPGLLECESIGTGIDIGAVEYGICF